jgi:cephalosporin hydroxylase
MQHAWEFAELLNIYHRLKPRNKLEIGIWHGGTLSYWLDGGLVVAIDKDIDESLSLKWRELADETDTDLHLFEGSSHDSEVVNDVSQLAPFDWIFIDGDHSESGVLADWLTYKDMAAPGAVVVFHDVLPIESDLDVPKFWQNLCAEEGRRTITILGHHKWGGLGVVFL